MTIVDYLAVKNKICIYLDNVNFVMTIRLLQQFPNEDFKIIFQVLDNLKLDGIISINENVIKKNTSEPISKPAPEPKPKSSDDTELTWDICVCGHPKYKHTFDYNPKKCSSCECENYEYLKELTDTECKIKFHGVLASNYKKYFRELTTTVDLRESYGDVTGDVIAVQCFICWQVFENEEKVLAHLHTHKDREFLDSL